MELSKGRDRLPRGAMETLQQRFPHLNLTAWTVQRIVTQYKKQARDNETAGNVRLTRRRASLCGGQGMVLTRELASKLIEINDRHWGRLSCKKLAGELTTAGFACSVVSVYRWCKILGATRRRRYIKPKLTLKHRRDRLSWAISRYDRRKKKFGDNNNIAHGDEKWWYLMRDGSVCRVFPQTVVNDKGETERVVNMPADPRVYHKSRMPKVMFLAVTAKPRAEYGFDGKVGMWPFTVVRKAKRSHAKTGTVAGETDIIESVTVTAEEYRHTMLKKNGVFCKLREKMWWFGKNAGTPEAGTTLYYYQHDGARPHTAKANEAHWSRHGQKSGFSIDVVVQPAQSPDLNVNDLAFFSSLQSDTELVAKRNVFDLVAAVEKSWAEYPQERMEAVWRVLYASFKGIVTARGDNSYSHHTGSRAAHSASSRRGESHDRRFPQAEIDQATAVRDTLSQQLETGVEGVVSTSSAHEDTDDE
eukprot:scpid94515/ scgid32113/ 